VTGFGKICLIAFSKKKKKKKNSVSSSPRATSSSAALIKNMATHWQVIAGIQMHEKNKIQENVE